MPKSFAAAPVDSRPERRLNMKVEYNNDRHTGSRPSLLSPSLFCRISVSVFRTLSPSSNRRVGLYRQQKTPNQCRAGDSPFGSACFFSLLLSLCNFLPLIAWGGCLFLPGFPHSTTDIFSLSNYVY